MHTTDPLVMFTEVSWKTGVRDKLLKFDPIGMFHFGCNYCLFDDAEAVTVLYFPLVYVCNY